MTATTLDRGSEAGDSNVRSLAFFLGMSVFLHGVFFPREWFALGAGLALLFVWKAMRRLRIGQREKTKPERNGQGFGDGRGFLRWLTATDGLLLTLLGLSLLGLGHPVKWSEGWIEALRWGTFWLVYRLAREIRSAPDQERMVRWIEGIGVFLAILAWLPPLNFWAQGQGLFPRGSERLSSLLGYPNALGVYLAAVLLLNPRWKGIQVLLFLSLLNTGSRATIVLWAVVWSGRAWMTRRLSGDASVERGKIHGKIGRVCSLLCCLLLTRIFNPEAFQRLFNWGIRNSIGERLLYLQDGLKLAWAHHGLPQAGGWFAFPTVQNIPYWTTDPHSAFIRILLNQGIYGVAALILWVIFIFKQARQVERASVLLFLGMHTMIDTDFLFGTLGILFWTLFGMFIPQERKIGAAVPSPVVKGVCFFALGLFFLGAWVYPLRLHSPQKAEAVMAPEKEDNRRLVQALQKSLAQDQTQPMVRRQIARLELELYGAAGLAAAEDVLAWEKFNIRTYEWIEGCVLAEAEKRRDTHPEEALTLYQWSEKLPSRMERLSSVSAFERRLWPESENFRPSELMQLLASTANERQRMLRPF